MNTLKLSASLVALALTACQPAYHPAYRGTPAYGRQAVPQPTPTVATPSLPSSTSPVTYHLQSPATHDGSGTSLSGLSGSGTLVLYQDSAKFEQGNVKAAMSPTLNGVLPPAPPGFGFPNGTYFYEQTGTSTPRFELERMAPALGLKASDFGTWTQIDINKGDMTNNGFYAGGLRTRQPAPASAQAGTAVYLGSYIGRLRHGDAAQSITGSMIVQVDQNNNTVTAVFLEGPLAKTPLSIAGQLSGDTYTASYTEAGDHPVQCIVKGQIYRDSGRAETTGTVSGALGQAGEFEGSFGGHT
jgi:hypothetical protein